MTTTRPPENLLTAIRDGNRFLLTSHLSPDGDAIGSELGLARVLRKLGKSAVVWNRDATPGIYEPLPGSHRIHAGEEPPAGFPEVFDAVIALECPTLDRSGLEGRLGDLPVINIDHHLGNQHHGAINWVDTAAPAVGEMIHRLAHGLKLALDAETATCLYLTLVTDTGGFRFSNATPEAFEAAAELVREGAEPETVARWLYESRPAGSLRLLCEMLQTLELHDGGRIASVVIRRDALQRAGATPADTEGLVDYPRSIAGVDAVALLRETEEGRLKVSLRSRGEVDVEQVARRHGGGGHHNAAGFTADGPLEELRGQVVGELREVLEGA
ncbi:MAG TPA: bifunctional oligoribonuclease/PAP phosphatase NrnA [Thermoanaerobaculia bacterium]|nr:bifunctional oligoribonuclease/PAP phosphatase NrnA [Thermoanaerobaculia bacterium]